MNRFLPILGTELLRRPKMAEELPFGFNSHSNQGFSIFFNKKLALITKTTKMTIRMIRSHVSNDLESVK